MACRRYSGYEHEQTDCDNRFKDGVAMVKGCAHRNAVEQDKEYQIPRKVAQVNVHARARLPINV